MMPVHRVERTTARDPDRADATPLDAGHVDGLPAELDEAGDHPVRPFELSGGDGQLRQDAAVAGHDAGGELRPTDVEAEDEVVRGRSVACPGDERNGATGHGWRGRRGVGRRVLVGRHVGIVARLG